MQYCGLVGARWFCDHDHFVVCDGQVDVVEDDVVFECFVDFLQFNEIIFVHVFFIPVGMLHVVVVGSVDGVF